MAVEMEGLEFQIETKADESAKGIDALVKSFEKLKGITKGGLGLGSSVKQLEKLDGVLKKFDTSKLEGLGKALESVSKLGEVKISGSVAKQLGGIADVMDRITLADIERLEDMAKALRDLGEVSNVKIPKIRVPASGAAMDAVTPPTGAADSGMTQATSSVQEVSAAVDQVTQKTGFLKSILNGIGGVFQKGFSLGAGVLHKLGNAMTKVRTAAANARTAMSKLKDSMGNMLAARVKQTTAGMGQLFNSIKRIAMYRLIRFALSAISKAFKEGVNNLYQYSNMLGGQFAISMNSVATNALYLKNSLGAMAAPIINALAPAIDYLSGKIVSLLNLINMLIARLTGSSTYTAAKKISASYGDAFDSAAGSAKDAADKIKSYTTGIDELNIIQETPENSSGGGGGGGADYGSMFEEIPIDNKISDFADRLREAFDNADWKTLGTLIGTKVNEILDSVDYSGIGKKIGYAINGAVQTAYYFLDTVNFTNIGKHIAELVNAGLEEVDFTYVGAIIVKWFTLIPDMVIGAVTTLDWGLIARSVSDFFIGAFNEVTKWLNKYDWTQLGKDLWTNIKKVFANIDWSGVATSIFTALGTAIRSAGQFLGGFFGSIGADIKAWWDSEIKGQDWKETGLNLLKWIDEGFVNIGSWVLTNIVDPFCNALLGEDVWADIKQVGKNLWDGLCQGITDFFANPGEWIKTNIVDPFVNWFKDLFGIHSPSTVMEEIGKFITEGLLNGILAPFKAIGSWINTNIVQPLVQAFKESPVIEFTVGVVNGAKTWWKNVKDWWSGVSSKGVSLSAAVSLVKSGWSTVKGWIGNIPIVSQGISLLKSGWTTVRNWIGNLPTISQTISLLKSGWSSVKTWIGSLPTINQTIGLIKTGWTTVKGWIGNLPSINQGISLIKSGWTTVKNWMGTLPVISQSISLLKSGWTTVKNWIGTLPVISQSISLVKSGWTTVKNWIGTLPTISQSISLIKSGWTTVKNWIGTLPVISQGISLVKSGWTTVKNWIGTIPVLSQGISLLKSGWTSVKNWIGTLPVISQGISLFKSGWSTISNWIGTTTHSVGVSLRKNGWSSISSWIGTSVSVGISLFKSGWSSIKSFFGLANGGIVGANGGVKAFSSGGSIHNGVADLWNAIPKYAGGTINAHGSMFVAGEKGAELVGHVNGRTEVLNKSQLGQVMHRSIVDGMAQFAGYWGAVNTHMSTCTNAMISAMLVSADAVYAGLDTRDAYMTQGVGEWMDNLGNRVEAALAGVGSTEQIAEGVREGMYEVTARQNDLLREQNELLQRLLNKNTTVQIGNKTIKDAVVTQENADGYRFTK